MKKLLLIVLLLVCGCKKDSSSSSSPTDSTDKTTPFISEDPTPPNESIPVAEPVPVPTPTWTDEFMTLVNDHRRSLGLRSLVHHDDLGEIARTHSTNMASGKVAFGHSGFSSRCSEGRNALGGGNWCGENVAAGQKTPQAAFSSWMNSSGHRANIESSKATHTGLGYAKNSSGKYYWTQIFIQN